MSDRFYKVVKRLGGFIFWVSGRPVVIGRENVPREGAVIVAANHHSAYDVPVLIHHTPRALDFVSTTEVFSHWFAGWFYGHMNAFPLERFRPDPGTVRIILTRLKAGRAVAMFPEGRLQSGEFSMFSTRKIKPGLGRLAGRTGAVVVPCVVLGTGAYRFPWAWLPLRRTRCGVIYGRPLRFEGDAARLEEAYVEEMVRLRGELVGRMGEEQRAEEQRAK